MRDECGKGGKKQEQKSFVLEEAEARYAPAAALGVGQRQQQTRREVEPPSPRRARSQEPALLASPTAETPPENQPPGGRVTEQPPAPGDKSTPGPGRAPRLPMGCPSHAGPEPVPGPWPAHG